MTKLTYRLTFRDQAGRDHMTTYDGFLSSFDNVEKYVAQISR